MVALVRAEVIAEAVDALGKQRDLDFGRAGVVGGAPEFGDHIRLSFQWRETSCIDP